MLQRMLGSAETIMSLGRIMIVAGVAIVAGGILWTIVSKVMKKK